MTEDMITSRTQQIYSELSLAAMEACTLYNAYNSARHNSGLGSASYKLEQYCKSHPEIRPEIQSALNKIRALLKEDAADPAVRDSDKQKKIKRLRYELSTIKKSSADKIIPKLKYVGYGCVALSALSLVVSFVCILINTELSNAIVDYYGVRGFWFGLIAAGVLGYIVDKHDGKRRDKESQLYWLEQEEKEYSKDRLLSALMDEQRYEIILELIDGRAISSIVFE